MLNNFESMAYMTGRRLSLDSVLIVEDEGLLSMSMDDLVRGQGATEVQICRNLDEALEAARTGSFDCAVLDLSLAGTSTYPVADMLALRNIPFFFWTGRGAEDVDERYRDRPVLPKPHSDEQFITCLEMALGR
jgi:CheY-like chemotaxis protein